MTGVGEQKLTLGLTLQGRLILGEGDDGTFLDLQRTRRLQDAFARDPGHGLLQLGANEVGTTMGPALSFLFGIEVAPGPKTKKSLLR